MKIILANNMVEAFDYCREHNIQPYDREVLCISVSSYNGEILRGRHLAKDDEIIDNIHSARLSDRDLRRAIELNEDIKKLEQYREQG